MLLLQLFLLLHLVVESFLPMLSMLLLLLVQRLMFPLRLDMLIVVLLLLPDPPQVQLVPLLLPLLSLQL